MKMSNSLAKQEDQRQGVKDQNGDGQEVARDEDKSCGVKHTSIKMQHILDEGEEDQTTAQDEEENVSEVNEASDTKSNEEVEQQDIQDEHIVKSGLGEEEKRPEGGKTGSEILDKFNSKKDSEKLEIKGEKMQKLKQQKKEIKHECAQTANELSDSSEMSGTVSESSQSESSRLSPTLFLPEARVRLPKKATEEVNKIKKKREKRKLKLSEMDPEDLILRASEKGRYDLVEYSLNKNGSLHECQDQDGYTPLHRASYGGHLSIVELLVFRGANIEARTIDGWEPLHSACRWGQKDVASYLLDNGANINAKTNGNQTPLHLAALGVNGSETLQLLLCNKTLDRTVRNNQGEMAEDVARRCGKWVELFKT